MKILLPDSNRPGINIKSMKNKEALLAPGFTRPETYIHPYKFGIVLYGGGMGDFIAYSRAFQWMAEHLPHLYGTVFYPNFMTTFASYFFADFPHWKVESNAPCQDQNWNPGFGYIDPFRNGRVQFITGHGAHPTDLGFMYYANMRKIPAGFDNYPKVDFDADGLPKGLEPKKYAVFTPGAIVESRTVPGHFWNPIVEHVKNLGLIPVVLGKSEVTNGYLSKLATGMNMDGVMSFWDKTSLIEAARIIQHSAVTIGLDNGLLHLAGCTEAPIVFGYNVTEVELRRPRREIGRTVDVFLTPEELACSGCLTRIKGNYANTYDVCIYKTIDQSPYPICIDLLFANNGTRWINAINLALEAKT